MHILCYIVGRNGWIELRFTCPLRHICLTVPAFFRPPNVPCRTTFSWSKSYSIRCSTKKSHHKGRILFVGRNGWIRTTDLCDPNAAFYQAELRSVRTHLYLHIKKKEYKLFFHIFLKKIDLNFQLCYIFNQIIIS